MTVQSEYFVIETSPDSLLIHWDQESGDIGMGKPVEIKGPLHFRLDDDFSRESSLQDYQECEHPIISPSFAEFLSQFDLYGVQFFPALVSSSEENENVFSMVYLHIWNRISCIDEENSQLDKYDDGAIFGIDKLVLNESALNAIDLEKRLVFELGEKTSVLLIHKKLKEEIDSFAPTGIEFYTLEEWNTDIRFD